MCCRYPGSRWVLGDRDNHVASLHLTQMLYIWPYFMFFSFPMLYPWVLNLALPQRFLPMELLRPAIRRRLPSLTVSAPIIAVMMAVVHYNTIVHPFTLADNRHYMFYVFRILTRHWFIKYLAVPVYFVCAWATIAALGGPDAQIPASRESRLLENDSLQVRHPPDKAPDSRGNVVPLALVWLLASSLSLITAPLVEPRYFILPWLFWRLQIMTPYPNPLLSKLEKVGEQYVFIESRRGVDRRGGDRRLLLETAWFLIINFGTGYMFLYRGFTWSQEPGKVQRFMW